MRMHAAKSCPSFSALVRFNSIDVYENNIKKSEIKSMTIILPQTSYSI